MENYRILAEVRVQPVEPESASRPVVASRRKKWAPLWIPATFLLANLAGVSYYLLPIAERMRHPLHSWFKPSGHVGQAAGVVAFALFVFMYLYPLRKRFRALRIFGSLPAWLDVHIVAGLSVPIIGAMHAGWRFQGLIGLGYMAMLAVSLSGIVGRYLYMHIPRRRSGVTMSLDEISNRRRGLAERISLAVGEDATRVQSILESVVPSPRKPGVRAALLSLITGDMARRRAVRRVRGQLRDRGLDRGTIRQAMRLIRRHLALTQQLGMLDTTNRLFRLWHVVHRPFSITALVAVVIHVVVAVSLGVTWFW